MAKKIMVVDDEKNLLELVKSILEQEGYKVIIREDTQLQEALDLFEKFSSLDEMFDYAEELKVAQKE